MESDIAAGTSTNKLCLDDKGNGNANNNPVITWACNSADKAQQWTQYSDNSIRINGKCLDVNKNGTADRTPVDLFTCNGGQNQQWALIPIASTTAPNRTELKGIQSNKCLDIKGSSTANGTQLEIFTCNGGANQGWAWNFGTLPPATGGGGATVTHSGSIQSNLTAAGSKTPLCVDDTNNSSTNGNPVQTWTCNNGNAQRWTGYSDNTIKINGKCLEVAGQGTGNGAKVDIYTCNGGKNQQWKQNGKEPQDVQAPTMCLDITGQSTKNGTKLEIYKCNGGNNQAWTWNGSGSTTGGGGNNGGGGGNTNWAYAAPTGASYTHTKGSTKITLKWSAVTKDTSGKTETAPSGYTVAFYDNSGKLLDQSTTGSTNPTFTETNIKMNTLVHLNIWANGGPKSPANTRVPGSGNITW